MRLSLRGKRSIIPCLIIAICLGFIVVLHTNGGAADSRMPERIARVRPSIVQIFTRGEPSGTGFIIDQGGLIATCFHVIEGALLIDTTGAYSMRPWGIRVRFDDGETLSATLALSSPQAVLNAAAMDYAILRVPRTGLTALPLGLFSDVVDGSPIYAVGFPYGISQPVTAAGILSTKFQGVIPGARPQAVDAAWLDIAMNPGNSGGPVIVLRDDPEMDAVVGIADFNLNPFSAYAKQMQATVKHAPTGALGLFDIDMQQFIQLMTAAVANASFGVGGCVSIDYLHGAMED